MAEPFKNMFNPAAVNTLAELLGSAHPFDRAAFTEAACDGLDALELKDRVAHIAAALRASLDPSYPRALEHILGSLPDASPGTADAGQMSLWPLLYFVEVYGLEHPDASIDALKALTRRFSAEFAIRPYLERYPDRTFAALEQWVIDPDPRVRRLVSEGTRPRLPWGRRLRHIQANPDRTLALLHKLRDDTDEVVRRSVANHVNDVSKDHPALVVDLTQRWMAGASTERKKLIRHALRTLIKKGDEGALAVLGYGPPQLRLHGLSVMPKTLPLGGKLTFSAQITATADAPQPLIIDYAVHHVKADGSLSPKVFKGGMKTLQPGASLSWQKTHTIKKITTRRYYPGTHQIELLINGKSMGMLGFELEI